MKILLFVEGKTENIITQVFLKKWLDSQLDKKISVKPIVFDGCGDYLKRAGKKSQLHLDNSEVIAIFGLLDLYGLPEKCKGGNTVDEKTNFARKKIIESLPKECRPKFHQHFAVHELEAWLLSDPKIFPNEIKLPGCCDNPETVDFDTPPAKLLKELFRKNKKNYSYKKTIDGVNLFKKLSPDTVRDKCPNFKKFTDEILAAAKNAQKRSLPR
ncbi:MAG TPA: DUF4276 family protein [bacterium]|nr:DUF4276 family protein [bacterium]